MKVQRLFKFNKGNTLKLATRVNLKPINSKDLGNTELDILILGSDIK